MTQYVLLIHGNTKTRPTTDEWDEFLAVARQSGLFQGGSAIGDRITLGDTQSAKSSSHIAGCMRFDADDRQQIVNLLQKHPVIVHGGSAELCEMPRS